jgi:hypothetical protein
MCWDFIFTFTNDRRNTGQTVKDTMIFRIRGKALVEEAGFEVTNKQS